MGCADGPQRTRGRHLLVSAPLVRRSSSLIATDRPNRAIRQACSRCSPDTRPNPCGGGGRQLTSWTKISRSLVPLAGPTMPRCSMHSTILAARL